MTNGYGLHIRGAVNPEIRLQEDGQSGSTYLRGFADNYGALKVENTTTNESTILDIDVESDGTGSQTIRLFRTSNSGATDTKLQILAPGTVTETLRIDADDGALASASTIQSPRLETVSSVSGTLTAATHAGRYLICSGNVTLPATSTEGEHYTILNTTGGDITVGRNGNNINGAASDATVGTYNGATAIAIGSNNWIVLGV